MTNPIVLLSEIILLLFMLVLIASLVIFSLTRQTKSRNVFGQEGHGYGYNPYIDINGVQGKGGFTTQ